MKWFKKKSRTKSVPDIHRMQMQINMVQLLLDNGYNWNDIFEAIGFSEASIRFMQSTIKKNRIK